jgi:D-amino-acid dehydrogenase
MPDNKNQSVAVIGAGIVGICTATELQSAGFQVTLIDKGDPARQTSYGNASYIATEFLGPLATPENIVSAIKLTFSNKSAFKVTVDHVFSFVPWAIRFLNAARKSNRERSRNATVRLNKHALQAWKEILERSGNLDMLLPSGYIKLWENLSDLPEAQQTQITMQQYGHPCELYQGDALFELEPALSSNIKLGLFFPNGHQLHDPYQTALKLFEYFLKQGGQFLQADVLQLNAQNNSAQLVTKLATKETSLDFDKAVICAGAWSKQLLKGLGLNVPLAAERGYHLTLPETPVRPRHILESVDRHVVSTPLDCGLRITGFGEYSSLNSKPIEKRYSTLGDHMDAIYKDIDCKNQLKQTWMGIRPTLPDSVPVIDLHPQHPQIGMVFGHHHLGVTQAPISAKLITGLMKDGLKSDSLTEFSDIFDAYSVSRF